MLSPQNLDLPDDSKPWHPDIPALPRPHGQPEGSQNELSPSSLTTTTTSTPSPPPTLMSWTLSLLDLAQETPCPHPHPLSLNATNGQAIPSTLMAPNTSGTSSPPLIEQFLAPTVLWPGNYADATLRTASTSEQRTEHRWDGTS
ncbi:hypothetical protein ARMSODRAFT_1015288 [Armillaria solidipes]|uniref:Uncharacterized protein n=1 Tax=Armillaria solidipes TaxID=1076256 RepID=A0A2H3CC89_9AGAR|nr:hypothetical protein ARMSODRAFT_1015288 [Armillaria solidipes]